MNKGFWFPAGAVLGAVLASVIVFEIILRLFTPEPENLAKLKSSDNFLYENKPNAVFTNGSIGGEFKNEIHYNSYGFRDDEFSRDKKPGVYRIAVLGDSQEEALQVPLEQTWEKVMARDLSQSLGRPTETYSFGVSGYGIDQEWLTLTKKVWQFSPDMVILAFSPNDVGDTFKNNLVRLKDLRDNVEFFSSNKNRLVELRSGKLEVISASERAGGNFFGKSLRETYLYNLVVKAASGNQTAKRVVDKVRTKILGFPKDDRFFLSDAQLVQGPFEVEASRKNPPAEVLKTWQVIGAMLADMKRQADDHGAKFLVTVNIPSAQVDSSDWQVISQKYDLNDETAANYQINTVLFGIAQDLGIILYDPRLDAIEWFNTKGLLHFPKDKHFNANGNEFMGIKVAEFISANQLIK